MARNIKRFFAGLSWSTGGRCACPVFTQDEIEHTPFKRLKHLLLVYSGLRSASNLRREILCFPMSHEGLLKAEDSCRTLLSNFHDTPKSALIVLKMIYSTMTMGLPNYRVTKEEQLSPIFAEIEKVHLGNADELWLCLSNVSLSGSNLGGRFAFRLDLVYTPEIIEIVWFTSPRMLDSYRRIDYPYPYIKASRLPGCLNFSIEDSFIPQQFSTSQTIIEKNIMQDYHFVLLQLNTHKERIANLCEILRLSHVKEVVLEFKIEDGHFQFIDWDTDAETNAIW